MTEREVQIAIEAEFFRAGAVRTAYPSIVASGPNGAYLHYVYGQDDSLNPTTRTIQKGELLLIDAGGEFGGYASDVTRTMVVGDEPTDVQSFLWELVFRAQELAIDRCRPGEEWREVHLDSARVIGSGLVELGILRGEVDALVASGAVALFYPHGLGHLIGLTVHDAGGYPPGREPGSHPQSRYLRTDRTLEAGMITSVEPGVYFIDAILADPLVRQQFAAEVVWDTVDLLRGFGGIRIEDDIHVTNGEPEVLSGAIAKPLRIG
jgi:Xaa-Pro aminopeptidase